MPAGEGGACKGILQQNDLILDGRDEKEFRRHVAVQAAIEIGFEKFLKERTIMQ